MQKEQARASATVIIVEAMLPGIEKSEVSVFDPRSPAEDMLIKQFRKYDHDGDGSLTRDEVLLMFEVNMYEGATVGGGHVAVAAHAWTESFLTSNPHHSRV